MNDPTPEKSYALQVLGSLLAAVVIIVITINIVSSRVPTDDDDSGHGGRDRVEQEDNSGPGSND